MRQGTLTIDMQRAQQHLSPPESSEALDALQLAGDYHPPNKGEISFRATRCCRITGGAGDAMSLEGDDDTRASEHSSESDDRHGGLRAELLLASARNAMKCF